MQARAALLVLLLCSCEPHDAPADTGSPDGAPDGAEVGPDAVVRPDVGVDAALPAGWRPVHGSFPDAAELAFAEPSLVAATRFPVEACPDRPGCRRIVQSWHSGICGGAGAPCRSFGGGACGHHDGSLGSVCLRRQTTLQELEVWVVDDQGRAMAGFRSRAIDLHEDPALALSTLALGSDLAAITIVSLAADSTARQYLLAVPLSAPFAFHDLGELAGATPGDTDVAQRLQVTDVAAAADMTSLTVVRVPLDGGTPTAVTGGEGTLGGIAGETVFFDTFRTDYTDIRVARPGEAPEILINGPRQNSNRIATDGNDLVWLEYDLDATSQAINIEIWTAPYAERAADVVGRRLDGTPDLGIAGTITVGHGYAAISDQLGGLHAYRLSDGYRAVVPPPTGEAFYAPAYVGPTEIAVGSAAGSTFTQLCFIDIAGLDWQPPS